MKAVVGRHPVIAFFALSFALSWSMWVPMALLGVSVRQGSAWPTHMAGLAGPALAALALTAVVSGQKGLRELWSRIVRRRVQPRWYLAAFSPLLLFITGAAASAVTGAGWPDAADLGSFIGLPFAAAPILWLMLIAGAFGEEIGWRGFAVAELLKRQRLTVTALVVGVLWALWHAPLFFVIENYRGMGIGMVPMFTLGILSGSIVLAWLYRASGGSILLVAIWHANFNLATGTAAATDLIAAVVSAGVMVWAACIVVVEVRRSQTSRASTARRISVPTALDNPGPTSV